MQAHTCTSMGSICLLQLEDLWSRYRVGSIRCMHMSYNAKAVELGVELGTCSASFETSEQATHALPSICFGQRSWPKRIIFRIS